jgi:hypothetical protein
VTIAWLGFFLEFTPKIQKGVLYLVTLVTNIATVTIGGTLTASHEKIRRKMKNTILFLSFFLIISCQSIDNRPSVFSKSDEINFYRVKEESENLFGNDSIEVPKVFTELFFDSKPLKLPNSKVIENLEQYYQSIPLNSESTKKIIEIFNDAGLPISNASFSVSNICDPIYRDILVFKREGKVTAYAKICLSCYKNYVVLENNHFENIRINYEDLNKALDSLASR